MIINNYDNIKVFMNNLLLKETFDSFLVSEIKIVTDNTYLIDGHINKNYYDTNEYNDMGCPVMSEWKNLKPLCYNLIKGNKLPLSMNYIFSVNKAGVSKLIENSDSSITENDINNLFLNIKFNNNILTYSTGVSLNIFTLDKSFEKYYDNAVERFINSMQ